MPILSRARLVPFAARLKRSRALDTALRYQPTVRAQVASAIKAFDRLDAVGRRDLADRLTARVVRRARQTPYGQQFGPDFREWPILAKQSLRDAPERFTKRGAIRVPAATGGTTGLPVRLWRSLGNIAAEQVFLDRLIAHRGLSWADARIAVLRGDAIPADSDGAPYSMPAHGGRRLIFASSRLSADSVAEYVARLEAFRADVVLLYPTTAANLLRLMARKELSLRVPVVVTCSERLDTGLRSALGAAFAAEVIDFYGQAERLTFAIGRPEGGYVFDPAYGRAELLSADDDEVIDGLRLVRVIGTGYWNAAMPLVRYDVGDRIAVAADTGAAELEEIGLGLRPFSGIAGRDGDYVFAPDGTMIPGLNQLPREVPNLLQLQIVQHRRDGIKLRVLARPEFGSDDARILRSNAAAKLPPEMSAEIELVERLETTAQGKTPFIIRELNGKRARPRDAFR